VSRQEPTGGGAGWVWSLLGGAVAITVFAGGGFWLLSSPGDEGPPAVATPGTPATPAATSTGEAPAPVAQSSEAAARCWDGSAAAAVDDCSLPDGAAGLAWLFPQLPGQSCHAPRPGGHGVVVRLLCAARLSDGTTVRVGYYQWDSVAAADAYYGGQPLRRVDSEGFHGWRATIGLRIKKAVLYADAPYSRTLLYRVSASGSPELKHLQPRSPERVRGEPVG
jgi:hypothetical protein